MPECAVPQPMDSMWWFMELATMVMGLHSARFPYMELHEKYSI
jgi:hypothetical protein